MENKIIRNVKDLSLSQIEEILRKKFNNYNIHYYGKNYYSTKEEYFNGISNDKYKTLVIQKGLFNRIEIGFDNQKTEIKLRQIFLGNNVPVIIVMVMTLIFSKMFLKFQEYVFTRKTNADFFQEVYCFLKMEIQD